MEIGRLFSSRSYAPLQAGLAELGPRVLAVPPDLKMQASCLPWRCRLSCPCPSKRLCQISGLVNH